MEKCIRCNRPLEQREEHHIIPKFFYSFFKLKKNPDLYRISMCVWCHSIITTAWSVIFEKMDMMKTRAEKGHPIDDLDAAIENHYGVETLNYLFDWACRTDMKKAERGLMPNWLNALMLRGESEGRRHKARYVIMINMKRRGFSDDNIIEAVFTFNGKCKPPDGRMLVARHIKQTLRDFNESGIR